jgi:hypothetical protein
VVVRDRAIADIFGPVVLLPPNPAALRNENGAITPWPAVFAVRRTGMRTSLHSTTPGT